MFSNRPGKQRDFKPIFLKRTYDKVRRPSQSENFYLKAIISTKDEVTKYDVQLTPELSQTNDQSGEEIKYLIYILKNTNWRSKLSMTNLPSPGALTRITANSTVSVSIAIFNHRWSTSINSRTASTTTRTWPSISFPGTTKQFDQERSLKGQQNLEKSDHNM